MPCLMPFRDFCCLGIAHTSGAPRKVEMFVYRSSYLLVIVNQVLWTTARDDTINLEDISQQAGT